MELKLKTLSPLCKLFPGSAPRGDYIRDSALKNEVFSYQVAYFCDTRLLEDIEIICNSKLEECIKLFEVCLVPSTMPNHDEHDENIITDKPGLFPDLLRPISSRLTVFKNQWRSIWVSVQPDGEYDAGSYPIEIIFKSEKHGEVSRATFTLELLNASLPKQTLKHTEWFHTDSIINYYNVEAFSNRYWELVGEYLKTASSRGINMILTPVLTPPLDTEIGGERKTVQLVEIEEANGLYSFNFDRLRQWLKLCKDCGIEYIEINHMFTQWGATSTPKVIAKVDGKEKRIFGWDTQATSNEYRDFLEQLIPELIGVIKEFSLEKNTYFHISDEPEPKHRQQYTCITEHFKKLIPSFPIIDALSDYEFYSSGAVEKPVVASDHIDGFINNGVQDLWAYYCVSQYKKVSNRFFGMHLSRARILGIQLYKFKIEGFLHWGYNFYNSYLSKAPINPFCVTDAAGAYPSGDAFVVYPGPDGPWSSIRLEVIYQALQDMRALELLESICGRERVLQILEDGIPPITFKEYPHDEKWLLRIRHEVNEQISKHYKNK